MHILQFVGRQAAYYETDSCDALRGFSFGGAIGRQTSKASQEISGRQLTPGVCDSPQVLRNL